MDTLVTSASTGFDNLVRGRRSHVQRRTTVLSATQSRNDLQKARVARVPASPAPTAGHSSAFARATRVVRFDVSDTDGSPADVGGVSGAGGSRSDCVRRARQRSATMVPARDAAADGSRSVGSFEAVDTRGPRIMTAEEEQERLRAMYLRVPDRALTTAGGTNVKGRGRKTGLQRRSKPALPQQPFQRQRKHRQSIRGAAVVSQRPDFLQLLQAWYIRDIEEDADSDGVKVSELQYCSAMLHILVHFWLIR